MSATMIEQLLRSDDACVRYRARVQALGENRDSPAALRDRRLIPDSPRVRRLLSEMRGIENGGDGLIPLGVYDKWRGGHWVLAFLSELGYPPGDARLKPMADRCADWALGMAGKLIDGRWRRCASQQAYAVLYLMKLGFHDGRVDRLIEKLIEWQWPDGGWNCDKRPEASHASFHESLLPTRALFHYAGATANRAARSAARKAARLFLDRRLLRRKSTGEIIDPAFARLHYPYHWRYNILHGLKAMAEAGLARDSRCRDALEVLEGKRLPDGGFPCEKREYVIGTTGSKPKSLVDWGPVSVQKSNPFVTLDALFVLRCASTARLSR